MGYPKWNIYKKESINILKNVLGEACIPAADGLTVTTPNPSAPKNSIDILDFEL